MRFIAENPQHASKRDIAKAFWPEGEARVELKGLLRSLEEDGLLEKKRKSLVRPGGLPPVTVLDIYHSRCRWRPDRRPAEWLDDDGVAPAVLIKQSSVARAKGKTPVGGLGDRVLAKIFPAKERWRPAYTARIIKVLDKRKDAVLGRLPRHAGRWRPTDADRQAGEELLIDPDFTGDAQGRRSRRSASLADRAATVCRARRCRTSSARSHPKRRSR